MKVYFLTLGCRVNQYETDALRSIFLERGHELAEKPEDADCCVVNTCSVTSEADRKSRQMLRRMARLNPDTIVVAAGCSPLYAMLLMCSQAHRSLLRFPDTVLFTN